MQGPGEQPGAGHRRMPSVSVNLRDVGAGAGAKANLKEGAMFRASQILRRATLPGQQTLATCKRVEMPAGHPGSALTQRSTRPRCRAASLACGDAESSPNLGWKQGS